MGLKADRSENPAPAVGSGEELFILGYGNPGRCDDGLGPFIAEAMEAWLAGRAVVETAYQPALEHCVTLSRCRAAIFIDSARSGPAPFRMERLEPAPAIGSISFTTHLMSPAELLAVCEASFGRRPSAWLLGVRGYSYSMGEGLSAGARRNAARAVEYLEETIAEQGEALYV